MKSMKDNETLQVIVKQDSSGHRLDLFIQNQTEEISRSRAAALIRTGNIQINNKDAKPSSIVHVNDVITISVPAVQPLNLPAQEIPLDIIFQNENIVIINKSAGITVHPAPGHPDGTLVNALLHAIPDLRGIGGEQRPGIVHRLDKNTSGLIIVAKNDYAHRHLSNQLKNRLVSKTYIALLNGKLGNDKGEIDEPIGRNPHNRKKMAVVSTGRDAITRYKVLERINFESSQYTLVEAYPLTGRTHQIRVHFSSIRHPLVGDSTYGGKHSRINRQFLHAARLEFEMPLSGSSASSRVSFEAPLPDDLNVLLQQFRA